MVVVAGRQTAASVAISHNFACVCCMCLLKLMVTLLNKGEQTAFVSQLVSQECNFPKDNPNNHPSTGPC